MNQPAMQNSSTRPPNPVKPNIRVLCSLPAIILTAGIIIVSDMSQPPLPDLGFALEDKVAHALAYFGYGMCLSLAFQVNFRTWRRSTFIIFLIAFGSAFALSDEIHQYFVPGRECDFYDWLADFTGIICSLSLSRPIRKFINKVNRSNG